MVVSSRSGRVGGCADSASSDARHRRHYTSAGYFVNQVAAEAAAVVE
ncbi:MAG: hypothetical protein V2I32_11075 [Desulforhopalus sp.]|nr:hypothetical protein [Desulforhopalus sp.]